MAKTLSPTEAQAAPSDDLRSTSLQWNDKDMATNFANVVNVQSTREQVDLFFGLNRTWNAPSDGQVIVDLANRIILTPFAAKRLWTVLGSVLREYETRHGALDIDRQKP